MVTKASDTKYANIKIHWNQINEHKCKRSKYSQTSKGEQGGLPTVSDSALLLPFPQ